MNKMRYKDGKGDPRGFLIFLGNEGLPRGILPRYRGNRLHILFHICGVLVEHYLKFRSFLEQGIACGGLRSGLFHDFSSDIAHVQMQVMGLLGKLLTGPWMRKFYRSAEDQIDHVEGISIVRKVVRKLKEQTDPLELLKWRDDIFDDRLDATDTTLQVLRNPPKLPELFKEFMNACVLAILDVLERQ